jgi:ABC-2 type transport system permease protein
MLALLRLIWLEIKIFVREPMGFFGSVAMPLIAFIALTRVRAPRIPARFAAGAGGGFFDAAFVPVLASMLIVVSTCVSLVTIVSVYREGGILKRLRATPLQPVTILAAHVLAKLLFTLITVSLLVLAGRRYYPLGAEFPVVDFVLALLITTWSLLSMGFLIASLAPTTRVAQPVAALLLYPMVGLSGLFVPVSTYPERIAFMVNPLPMTRGVSLLTGIWHGQGWIAHVGDVGALAFTFVLCTVLSTVFFRWE